MQKAGVTINQAAAVPGRFLASSVRESVAWGHVYESYEHQAWPT